MKKIVVLGIFIIMYCNAHCQSTYNIGVLPGVNINKKLDNNWRLNVKTESRFAIAEGNFSDPLKADFNYGLTDVSAIVSKKVGLNHNLASGYLIRFRANQLNHRFIQQFTTIKRYTSFRLVHRISTDQTIEKEAPLTIRLRYRIALDIALMGQSVDINELYFKCSNEYLGILQGGHLNAEIRIVPLLGYMLRDHSKIEWGVDYRLNSFIGGATENRFWFVASWFLSL